MHFTVDKDESIDKQIRQDLDRVTESIHNAVSPENFEALFLVGGFGRGEGGVIIREGRYRPANDYDLELVTSSPVDPAFLSELGKQLASELKIPWVHIENHTSSQLSRMKFTMYHYDLKYASYCLRGEKDVIAKIPEMKPEDMPWREAENLLFTRLWGFIGAFDLSMLNRSLSEEEEFLLINQLSKSLIAVQDSVLILRGDYDASYLTRFEKFERIADSPKIIELCRWANDVKLAPSRAEKPELMKLFFRVKEIYLEAMLDMYSNVYRRKFSGWADYEKIHFTNSYTLLKRMYFFLWKRNSWFIRFLNYNLGVIYLLDALQRNEIQTESLERAAFYLSRSGEKVEMNQPGWEDLQKVALELRETLWH